MLRTADKRLFSSGYLKDIAGGRLQPLPAQLLAAPPMTASMLCWHDARFAEDFTLSGNLISQWNDRSGNGYHLTQSSGPNKPLYLPTGVIFDGSRWLTSSCPADDRSSSTYVVAWAYNASDYRTLLSTSSTTSGHEVRLAITDGHIQTDSNGVGILLDSTGLTTTVGTPFALASILSATTVEHRLDGSSGSASESTAFTAGRTLLVGADAGPTRLHVGTIHCILRYSVTHSTTEIDAMMGWLKSVWGTP